MTKGRNYMVGLVAALSAMAGCKMSNAEFVSAYWDGLCRYERACDPEADCGSEEQFQEYADGCSFDESRFEDCLDELENAVSEAACESEPIFLSLACMDAMVCETRTSIGAPNSEN